MGCANNIERPPNNDFHVAYIRSGMIHWVKNPEIDEIFVKTKGWINFIDLQVGDITTVWGEVEMIGTEKQVTEYLNHRYDHLDDYGDEENKTVSSYYLLNFLLERFCLTKEEAEKLYFEHNK